MALRVKTIEYAFQSRNSNLAAATRYDFGAITIYIPENSSRLFRSVLVQVTVRDNITSAGNVTSPLVGVKLGGAAFGDTTLGNPPSNSGESVHYCFWRDATAYFTSNFGGGTSQTCQVGVQFSTSATINHTVKLYITYEFDDTDQATLVKTVRIPMDSGLGALTASLAEIGTNQIPALDTFLPEDSKAYRNIWIELWYNESTTGTANDASLGMQIDSGSEHLTGIHESGLASSISGMYIWDQGASPAWATNAVHAFKLRSSTITTASTFNHVGIILCVTYEFAASSSAIINSLVLTMPHISMPGMTTSSDVARGDMDFYISEPATIALVQSGILLVYVQRGAESPRAKLGSGSQRDYTDIGGAYCGASFLTQRADSGGAGGAAFGLGRGKNTLGWTVFQASSTTTPCMFSAILYLNYTSGKASAGCEAHNHSTLWLQQQSQTSGTLWALSASVLFTIPEAEAAYFVNCIAAWLFSVWNTTVTTAGKMNHLDVEDLAGELQGQGFRSVKFPGMMTDGEVGFYPVAECLSRYDPIGWRRWTGDPQTGRRDPGASRRLRLLEVPNGTGALALWLTHHSITFTISGTVSGSAGGTVNLYLHRASDGELLLTGSRSGNGAFSFTWFDSAENTRVVAREDATHMGSSDLGVAS